MENNTVLIEVKENSVFQLKLMHLRFAISKTF